MELRWGFKSEANRRADELRREMQIEISSPLDPWKLARHLAVPILPLGEVSREAKNAVTHLTERDQGAFSAATVFCGYKRIIVLNDSHHPHRQASSLAHELGHIIFWHKPTRAISDAGSRVWNAEQEAEANFIAGALLVSEQAALNIAKRKQPLSIAAAAFGVSEDMMRYRLRITGAQTRVARAARYTGAHRRSATR